MLTDEKEKIETLVKRVMGEQNLYKMDFWTDVKKTCRHGNSVFCVKCRLEIEKEHKDE